MSGPEEREQRTENRGAETPTEFEQALTRAMRRVEPGAELSARLMAAADEAQRARAKKDGGRVLAFTKPHVWMTSWLSGAVAAVLVLGVLAGDAIHHEHRKDEAQRQFETATRITDQALEHTREQLARAGIPLDEQ